MLSTGLLLLPLFTFLDFIPHTPPSSLVFEVPPPFQSSEYASAKPFDITSSAVKDVIASWDNERKLLTIKLLKNKASVGGASSGYGYSAKYGREDLIGDMIFKFSKTPKNFSSGNVEWVTLTVWRKKPKTKQYAAYLYSPVIRKGMGKISGSPKLGKRLQVSFRAKDRGSRSEGKPPASWDLSINTKISEVTGR